MHGTDEEIVSIEASAIMSSKLVEGATLKLYEGAPHGMPITHHNEINFDLLGCSKMSGPIGGGEDFNIGGAAP